jgi:hypothetical protein
MDGDARVVHQYVDAAKCRRDLVDHRGDFCADSDISLYCEPAAAASLDLGHHRRVALGITGHDRHIGTGFGQRQCERATEATVPPVTSTRRPGRAKLSRTLIRTPLVTESRCRCQ